MIDFLMPYIHRLIDQPPLNHNRQNLISCHCTSGSFQEKKSGPFLVWYFIPGPISCPGTLTHCLLDFWKIVFFKKRTEPPGKKTGSTKEGCLCLCLCLCLCVVRPVCLVRPVCFVCLVRLVHLVRLVRLVRPVRPSVCVYVCVDVWMCVRVWMYVYVCVCMCMYVHMHLHMCIYRYMRTKTCIMIAN